MTRHRRAPGSRYLQGFSLIELMISLTIGLIITIAVFSAYMGAAGAGKMAEAQGRMNEDAQAALTILTQQLRMAGSNPDQAYRIENTDQRLSSRRNPIYFPTPTYDNFIAPTFVPDESEATEESEAPEESAFPLSNFRIRGCDGKFSNITEAANLDTLTCETDTAKPDSIAVNYEADVFNTIPTTDNLPTDCLGNTLSEIKATVATLDDADAVNDTEVHYRVADNRFYIDKADSIPSLYCKGNGGNTQPLVENIEDMQITYGVAHTNSLSKTVAGYLGANEFATELLALPVESDRWAKVVTVRICLLARTDVPVASDTASARYIKCDGTLETNPPDLRLRHTYSTTVVLRNQFF
ncbi:MAG: PilW family protein [Burkholderiaceae bacterium]